MSSVNKKGRSMIEMLGVLGVMSVIAVLGILIYQIALKNSKMNKLKQEAASIAQQLDTAYVRVGYNETGSVLGTDKTFQNLMVDTGKFKSTTTPFGGTYSLNAVSRDLFELSLNDVDSEDCSYVIAEQSLFKKLKNMAVVCTDTDGLNHYSDNNPNNPDFADGSNTLSDDFFDILATLSSDQQFQACRNSIDLTACRDYLESVSNKSYGYYATCFVTHDEDICTEAADFVTDCGNLVSMSASGVSAIVEKAKNCGYWSSTTRTKYGCTYTDPDSVYESEVCDQFYSLYKDDTSLNTGDASNLATACRSGREDICEIFKTAPGYEAYLTEACSSATPEICAELLEQPNLTSAMLRKPCNGNGESASGDAICEKFLSLSNTE